MKRKSYTFLFMTVEFAVYVQIDLGLCMGIILHQTGVVLQAFCALESHPIGDIGWGKVNAWCFRTKLNQVHWGADCEGRWFHIPEEYLCLYWCVGVIVFICIFEMHIVGGYKTKEGYCFVLFWFLFFSSTVFSNTGFALYYMSFTCLRSQCFPQDFVRLVAAGDVTY